MLTKTLNLLVGGEVSYQISCDSPSHQQQNLYKDLLQKTPCIYFMNINKALHDLSRKLVVCEGRHELVQEMQLVDRFFFFFIKMGI